MRKKLGEMLIEAGAIDEEQLNSALGHQRRWGGKLGKALVALNFATEDLIVGALAKRYNYPVVTFDDIGASPTIKQAIRMATAEFAEQHSILPYALEGKPPNSTISAAISDPSQFSAVDALRFKTGCKVTIALVGDTDLADAIRLHYYGEHPSRAAARSSRPPSGGEPSGFGDTVPRGGRSKGGLRSPSLTPAPQASGLFGDVPDSGLHKQQSDLSHLNNFEEPAALTSSSLKTLTEEELALLKELELYAQGLAPPQAKVKPIQLVAAVLQVLLKRKLISEAELLEELVRKK